MGAVTAIILQCSYWNKVGSDGVKAFGWLNQQKKKKKKH